MKKTLFVLTAVVVAYFSFHATAEPVSPAAATMAKAVGPLAPAPDSGPRQASGDPGEHLSLLIIPDTTRHPARVGTIDSSAQLKALSGFIQSTSDAIPQQTTAESTALSKSADWGILLIGFSALYMVTVRRNRAHL